MQRRQENPIQTPGNKQDKSAPRRPIFVGLSLCAPRDLLVAVKHNGEIELGRIPLDPSLPPQEAIYQWVRAYRKKYPVKIVALGIGNGGLIPTKEENEELASRLWLKEDIVPYIFKFPPKMDARQKAIRAVARVARHFKNNHEVGIQLDPSRRVLVSRLAKLEDYKRIVPRKEFRRLERIAEEARKKKVKICFFSSTSRGGGVALMRHALIRLFRLLRIDANWYVMNSEMEAFLITKKKIHNVLQGVATQKDELTERDKKVYEAWIKINAKRFTPAFKRATTIIIDDPQPSGMIPYIKEVNPSARIIYRSHIHIESDLVEKEGTIQQRTWQYLWEHINHADVFVSHPVREFIPSNIAREKVVMMGATTDELDGLNKKLSSWQLEYYLGCFNEILHENGQTPLDTTRPCITQIARFDPSKGIPDVLASYQLLRNRMKKESWNIQDIPQLVIVGHGAVDDPEGVPIFTDTMNRLCMDLYAPYANDIKVARVYHNDQILNAILSTSEIALQLSYREGYEIKVSEALAKGKPVIAYKTGGIPLQIEDTVTGYVVKVGRTEKVAEYLYRLLKDTALYETMSANAKARVRRDSFTVSSASRWLELVINNTLPHPIALPSWKVFFMHLVGLDKA